MIEFGSKYGRWNVIIEGWKERKDGTSPNYEIKREAYLRRKARKLSEDNLNK